MTRTAEIGQPIGAAVASGETQDFVTFTTLNQPAAAYQMVIT